MSGPTITLLYFASIRTSLVGEPDSQIIQLPASPSPFNLYDLRVYLVRQVHKDNEEFERALEKSTWSVDEEMIPIEKENQFILKHSQTICPIPPVSGG